MAEEEKEQNIEELETKLEECDAKCKEYLEGWKRERADFLNYKKEEMDRMDGIIKYCAEEAILKVLPILDNFYIAEEKMHDEIKSHKWSEGFLNIKKQIKEFLKSQGVEEIKAMGERFDPNFMEVVEEVDGGPSSAESGIIVKEIQKGYLLNGKVIRPAKVKVSK